MFPSGTEKGGKVEWGDQLRSGNGEIAGCSDFVHAHQISAPLCSEGDISNSWGFSSGRSECVRTTRLFVHRDWDAPHHAHQRMMNGPLAET